MSNRRRGSLIVGWIILTLSQSPNASVAAGSTESIEHGRSLFHGKGVCALCHGLEGDPTRRPQMNEDTAAVIASLNPSPPDLRVPDRLLLPSDQERFKAIREGHPGTGMLADFTLTDREITDILAYLAYLRGQAPLKAP